jgi:adenylosuccinate synthase
VKLLQKGKLNIGFCDGQWGSSGKGKFNGSLALRESPDFAVSHNSVNASHIWEYSDGRRYKFQHLPTSVVCPTTKVIIGAGASIYLDQLLREVSDWSLTTDRLFIHPNAVVITQDDIEYEKVNLQRIASTMTGNGAAAGRKVMRSPGVKLAKDFNELTPFVFDTTALINSWLMRGHTGILETAQGFDLSIDHGMIYTKDDGRINSTYPYCTSRNVDPLTFAGMSGVGHRTIGNVLLNLRTFPIRVGDGSNCKVDGLSGVNMAGSSSGDYYPDQEEMTWDEITEISGSSTSIIEMTSLTKRVRRVFSFSMMQLRCITRTVQPTHISLNFVNYLDHSIINKGGVMTLGQLQNDHSKVADLVKVIEANQYWASTPFAAKVVWLGTGPADHHLIELKR